MDGLNTLKFAFLNDIKNEVMKETEKEHPITLKRFIGKWSSDDTLFLGGIILAGITTILCFIL
jgi:hypothetical protein